MRTFNDAEGKEWVATTREETTPRHFGRFFLVIEAADGGGPTFGVPELRWQNAATAERTLRAMGEFELRRRLGWARGRAGAGSSPGGMGR